MSVAIEVGDYQNAMKYYVEIQLKGTKSTWTRKICSLAKYNMFNTTQGEGVNNFV